MSIHAFHFISCSAFSPCSLFVHVLRFSPVLFTLFVRYSFLVWLSRVSFSQSFRFVHLEQVYIVTAAEYLRGGSQWATINQAIKHSIKHYRQTRKKRRQSALPMGRSSNGVKKNGGHNDNNKLAYLVSPHPLLLPGIPGTHCGNATSAVARSTDRW